MLFFLSFPYSFIDKYKQKEKNKKKWRNGESTKSSLKEKREIE